MPGAITSGMGEGDGGQRVSGRQFHLAAEGYEAWISSVGASLRVLRHGGRDLVVPFDADRVRPAYRGATLAPWPNRIVDGRFLVEGEEHQLSLTEPARGHALHGLAAWLDFQVVSQAADEVCLRTYVVPQQGYPWHLTIEVTYSVGPGGLTQEVRAVNNSAGPAPYGAGPHPYLVAGEGPLDEWSLELPAAQVLEVTPDRLSPVALHDVGRYEPQRFDYREAKVIAAAEIDHAYTGLPDGVVTVRLTDPRGTGVEMTWGDECPWVQIHTADLPPEAGMTRLGLAVEPMTCAPDAFNAARYPFDTGLVMIDPGAEHRASWRIAAL